MPETFHPSRNLLLERLSVDERHRIFPRLELVELKRGAVPCEPHEFLRCECYGVVQTEWARLLGTEPLPATGSG